MMLAHLKAQHDRAREMAMATRPVPSSPSKGPSNETELPTYEQSNATNLDSIPATEASPAEVREFLKRLLIAKRPNVDSDQVSAKWVNGSGKELRTYPPSMFFEIFGREDGWMVYKELKLFMYVCERNDKSKEPTTEAKCGVIVFLSGAEALLIWALIHQWRNPPRSAFWLIVTWIALGVFTVGLIIVLLAIIASWCSVMVRKDENLARGFEDGLLKIRGSAIEKELQDCANSAVPPHSQRRSGC